MTIKGTLDAIRDNSMRATYNPQYREFRVTFPAACMGQQRRENLAYYTKDANDALSTAIAMRATFDSLGV